MEKLPWTNEEELGVLRLNSRLPTVAIVEALKVAGFRRTESAIDGQLRKMGLLSDTASRPPMSSLPTVAGLPERFDCYTNHCTVLSVPSTPLDQSWASLNWPVRVRMTRSSEELPFEEVWTSPLRPGCKFSDYALLRAVLSPT